MTVAAAVLAACAFNTIHGVAQLDEDVVTGLIDSNDEGDRVYVGTIYSGDRWDARSRLRAINPATGSQTASVLSSSTNPIRAVAQSVSDSGVWVLLDDGTLVKRTKDLSLTSTSTGFFTAPSGTLERFCDLEQLPIGHFVATGVYEDSNGDLRGFWNYVQPHPAFPGSWYNSWTSYPVDPSADPDKACPRVSHETNTSETIFLQPYRYVGGVTSHQIGRYEEYSWDGGGGNIYYGLSYVGAWTTSVSDKWLVGDITSEYGKVVIARQHVTDLSSGYLEIFSQTSGVSDDTVNLQRARAVDFALWEQVSSDISTVLWWGGREADTGSSYELGVFGFVE
ncbi:MAG TPA: hypothetical protein VM869_13325 [Enhygromyxa sp.]|nr:hypothetical protein [Enhygromyxa sp.]